MILTLTLFPSPSHTFRIHWLGGREGQGSGRGGETVSTVDHLLHTCLLHLPLANSRWLGREGEGRWLHGESLLMHATLNRVKAFTKDSPHPPPSNQRLAGKGG